MHKNTNELILRDVVNKVVHDPLYADIAKVPVWSLHQLALVMGALFLVIGGLFLAYNQVSLWLVYPLMIFGFYTAFTPLHDATHNAVSSNHFLNDLIGSISGGLLFPFVTVPMYRYFHLSHHRYVGDKDLDPDEAMVGIPTKYFPIGYAVFFFYEYFIFKWLFSSVWSKTPKRTKTIILISLFANLIFQFLLLTSPYWYEYLIWFFIPNRIGAAYTTFTFAHLPHPEGVHADEYPFESTYTITGNNFLLSSLWGQADHSMHHFLPNIPWYNYNKVWSLANGILHKQNIPEKKIYASPDRYFKDQLKSQNALSQKLDLIKVEIISTKRIAKDIKSFKLKAANGNILPLVSAGDHIDVYLPSGKIRQYSLINNPTDCAYYQIAVKKEIDGKGGSLEIHESLKTGDIIQVSNPKNQFILYENMIKYLLISGGIGVTPLISMAHRLKQIGNCFEFHICAKSEKELPFKDSLQEFSFGSHINIHIDKNGKSSIPLDKLFSSQAEDTMVYICGPTGFNQWVKGKALSNGLKEKNIMIEAFIPEKQVDQDRRSFDLVLSKSKKIMTVESHETIIDTLLRNDVKVDYSCLRGTCGRCVVKVLDGDIEHKDSFLSSSSKAGNKEMCLCVSRATSDKIVVDI